LSEKSRLANTRLTGQKIDTSSGEAGAENAIELADTRAYGVAFLGSESVFDGESFGGFMGGFFGTTPLGL